MVYLDMSIDLKFYLVILQQTCLQSFCIRTKASVKSNLERSPMLELLINDFVYYCLRIEVNHALIPTLLAI